MTVSGFTISVRKLNGANAYEVFKNHGCRLGALPRLPADHIPLPSSARLPRIEADTGLIRAVEGEEAE